MMQMGGLGKSKIYDYVLPYRDTNSRSSIVQSAASLYTDYFTAALHNDTKAL
jgi:hypothetical protein